MALHTTKLIVASILPFLVLSCRSESTQAVSSMCKPEQKTPVLVADDSLIASAYTLAISTISGNIDENGLIKAGGEYGGEWTRDIAINTWNACNLLFPEEAVHSLWSVTNDGQTVGHQYWDKIIWVPAAWEQYLVIGDKEQLQRAYECSAATMKEQEESVFDSTCGLFRGPSVFNDGIAGYEAPIPDSTLKASNVLKHKNTEKIKCLSTNCIYHIAYSDLAKMAAATGDPATEESYRIKAAVLREAIRNNFYDKEAGRLNYLIDQNGDVHHFQEALGYAFAIIGGVVTREEAAQLVTNAHVSPHGVPSVWPDFERFSSEKPGRHNNLVWPHVNAFFAQAALVAGVKSEFSFELRNLADLAINRSGGDFKEIYHPETGLENGGWQIGLSWHSCSRQTWSATGYLRMIYNGLFGISFSEQGMNISPDASLLAEAGVTGLSGLRYRNAVVNIAVKKALFRHGLMVNGRKVKTALIPADAQGEWNVELWK